MVLKYDVDNEVPLESPSATHNAGKNFITWVKNICEGKNAIKAISYCSIGISPPLNDERDIPLVAAIRSLE